MCSNYQLTNVKEVHRNIYIQFLYECRMYKVISESKELEVLISDRDLYDIDTGVFYLCKDNTVSILRTFIDAFIKKYITDLRSFYYFLCNERILSANYRNLEYDYAEDQLVQMITTSLICNYVKRVNYYI